MQLNQTNLRGILAKILSVDKSHIVPKQANWWNPQSRLKNISTWCAYRIKSNKPRTAPFYKEIDGVNCAVVLKLASIELQFVGEKSEEIAQSVAFWTLRDDVKNALADVHGSILYEDDTAISSDFFQDGANTVIAWNIPDLKIIWYDIISTNQNSLIRIDIQGNVNE